MSVRNAIWMWNLTVDELALHQQEDSHIASNIASISMYFLISLSTYHLLWMSVQRYFAIQYPVYTQQLQMKHVFATLALTWILSFGVATSSCK